MANETRRTNPLTERMLFDAILIHQTTTFYLYLTNKKFGEIDEAENNGLDDSLPFLYRQLDGLILKLKNQDILMKEFMIKYRGLIQLEKLETSYNET